GGVGGAAGTARDGRGGCAAVRAGPRRDRGRRPAVRAGGVERARGPWAAEHVCRAPLRRDPRGRAPRCRKGGGVRRGEPYPRRLRERGGPLGRVGSGRTSEKGDDDARLLW